jgi:single-stranded-DNA-specific exonuclease
LNAAGRLTDMRTGIYLMLEQDEQKAMMLARELDGLNRSRRDIEKEAIDSLTLGSEERSGVVVYDASWHEGVIGLIASRVKERLQLPVVALTQDEQGDLKGSARSINGVHVRDVLFEIDQENPGAIIKFGGHAMAAGLSLKADQLPMFKKSFAEKVSRLIQEGNLEGDLSYDFELPASYLSLDFAKFLNTLTPWGMGMKEPIFKGVFEVLAMTCYESGFVRMQVGVENEKISAVAFRMMPQVAVEDVCEFYYSVGVNRFRGQETLQLLIHDVWEHEYA